MKKHILHILLLLGGLAPLLCMGQTGNFWAFGKNKGLDFGTAPPTFISPTFGSRGFSISNSSTAISDCDGNVLFYASGDIVFNAQGDTMENGKLKQNFDGGSIGKSAMVLIPKPGASYLYLLFYMNMQKTRNSLGLNSFLHAEIDMLANGGLGTVVFKDSLVGNMKMVTCNLDVVKHANDTDFWLVTTPNESTYHSYKIDSNGLNQVPVASSGISKIHSAPVGGTQAQFSQYGFTRFTRDGRYLIVTGLIPSQSTASVIRYDFNSTTGKISNPFTLISQSQLPANHTTAALEISPNNDIAYFTSKDNLISSNVTVQYLWQVNIKNRSNFKTRINSHGATFSLNIGPDNLIYFVNNLLNPPNVRNYPALHYIPRPNEWGNKMGMRYLDTITYWDLFSLPRAYVPVYDYNFSSSLDGDCIDTLTVHYTGDTTYKRITLYYGDGDSTVVPFGAIQENMTFRHRYTSDGNKAITMKLETFFCDGVRYLRDNVYVRLRPTIDSLRIASIAPSCSSDTAELSLELRSSDSLQIAWSSASIGSYLVTKDDLATKHSYRSGFSADTARHIYVTAKSTNGCVSYDTVDYTPARLRTDTVRFALSGYRDLQYTLGTPHYFSCIEDELLYSDSTNTLSSGGVSTSSWSTYYTTSDAQGLASSNTSSEFVISDTNTLGCVAKDTFLLTRYESPVSSFALAKDSICASEQILDATNTTSYSDVSKMNTEWLLDDVTALTAPGKVDFTQNITTNGKYNVALISTSDLGCTDTVAKDFTVLANPIASYMWVDSVFCSDGGRVSFVSDSIPGFINSWSLNSDAAAIGNSYTNSNLDVGSNTLEYISENANGCSDTLDIDFTVHQQVITSLSIESDTLCANQEQIRIGLTTNVTDFSGGLSSAIFRDNEIVETRDVIFVQDLEYAADSVGRFIYQAVTNSTLGRCTDTQEVTITILESPENYVTHKEGGSCLGTEFEVYYTLDNEDKLASSRWDFGDGRTETDVNNVLHTYDDPGTYRTKVVLELDNGCSSESELPITVTAAPHVDFTYQLGSVGPDEVKLGLTGYSDKSIADWEWTSAVFGILTSNPVEHITKDTGFKEISLRIVDVNGCTNSITKRVPVFPEVEFYIPNAFTPNGDGLNDRFNILPEYMVAEYRIQVYNRWGQMVYDGPKVTDWKPSIAGVYMYSLNIRDILGERRFIKGTVTVLE